MRRRTTVFWRRANLGVLRRRRNLRIETRNFRAQGITDTVVRDREEAISTPSS